MDVKQIEAYYLKKLVENITKLKNVKSALHVKKAGPNGNHVLRIRPKDGLKLDTIEYKLNAAPSIESEDEFDYIYNDLKKKGYG